MAMDNPATTVADPMVIGSWARAARYELETHRREPQPGGVVPLNMLQAVMPWLHDEELRDLLVGLSMSQRSPHWSDWFAYCMQELEYVELACSRMSAGSTPWHPGVGA